MIPSSSKLLIDSDVLIQAHRQYYAFDICPGFWNALLAHHTKGSIVSIEPIKEEIKGGHKDKLHDWVHHSAPDSFFTESRDVSTLEWYAQIIRWVQGEKFTEAAKAEYAKVADGWIVAKAKANGYTVVTNETLEIGRLNKIKIPNICKQFKIPYINTFEMLRMLQTQFSWQTQS